MKSKTVRRPSSSSAVVTTPSGLWKASQRRATCFTARPDDRDPLPLGIHLHAQGGDLAVHPHLALLDQCLGGAARGDSGAGEGPLEPHFAHDSAST